MGLILDDIDHLRDYNERPLKIHSTDSDNYTPLQYHAKHVQNIRVMRLLLMAGSNPDASDPEGIPPLLHVCNSVELVDLLVEFGGDVNVANRAGETALHLTNNPIVTEMLLEYGAQPNRIATPHFEWSGKQYGKIASSLLIPLYGQLLAPFMIPIHLHDVSHMRYEYQPIHRTTDLRQLELLLEAGADPNALLRACRANPHKISHGKASFDALTVAPEHPKEFCPLFQATSPEHVKLLLKHGASLTNKSQRYYYGYGRSYHSNDPWYNKASYVLWLQGCHDYELMCTLLEHRADPFYIYENDSCLSKLDPKLRIQLSPHLNLRQLRHALFQVPSLKWDEDSVMVMMQQYLNHNDTSYHRHDLIQAYKKNNKYPRIQELLKSTA